MNKIGLQPGFAPIRRTLKYLGSGKLVFKDTVQIMTLNYNTDEYVEEKARFHPVLAPFYKRPSYLQPPDMESHKGAQDFVIWDLPR